MTYLKSDEIKPNLKTFDYVLKVSDVRDVSLKKAKRI